jgi:2-haloacid dehalogenase
MATTCDEMALNMPDATVIQACAFDAYGTLLDLNGAIAPVAARLGHRATRLLEVWRATQLQYTWLRSLMARHADFAQVTSDALEYACATVGADAAELQPMLRDAFYHLPAYADAGPLLRALRGGGLKTAVLSNGTPAMLEAGLSAAGLRSLIDAVLSVEQVQTYKPSPAVYHLASAALRVAPQALAFVSANAWDAAGAASAGLHVIWINRTGAPPERLPYGPAIELTSLAAVAAALGVSERVENRRS